MIKEKHNFNLDDGSEDGIDMEETRYPYYNDNLDLVGYTSELRESETGKFFAFVDFTADDDIGRIRLCPHCLEYEIHNKLGPKIKKKGEPRAPDADQWLSCYQCGNTFPVHQTFTESKIKDSVETTDNPFNNESIFLSGESRKTQRRKRERRDRYNKGVTRHISKRFKSDEDEDPEIQAAIDKGLAVNILYDSSC
jgi:hypothetical protein